jgi:hypothetical protein
MKLTSRRRSSLKSADESNEYIDEDEVKTRKRKRKGNLEERISKRHKYDSSERSKVRFHFLNVHFTCIKNKKTIHTIHTTHTNEMCCRG